MQLLVSLVRSYRCAEEGVDADLACLEAAQLSEAIWRKKQPHGAEVLRIVSTRSKSQLTATFQCYKKEHGSDIDEVPFTHLNYHIIFFFIIHTGCIKQLASQLNRLL